MYILYTWDIWTTHEHFFGMIYKVVYKVLDWLVLDYFTAKIQHKGNFFSLEKWIFSYGQGWNLVPHVLPIKKKPKFQEFVFWFLKKLPPYHIIIKCIQNSYHYKMYSNTSDFFILYINHNYEDFVWWKSPNHSN
jgi:hypothetical protein